MLFRSCRNTSAHLNLEILNDRGRRGLREICEFILKNIEIERSGLVMSFLSGDGVQTDVRDCIGEIVELTKLELTSSGVLRGIIAGTTAWASLSKKHLKEKGVYARKYIGRTVKVKIVRWDNNAQKYNAEWI